MALCVKTKLNDVWIFKKLNKGVFFREESPRLNNSKWELYTPNDTFIINRS